MSETYTGIDISGWQAGLTDGGILTRGGVRFVIAKLSEGRSLADKAFDAHYRMCEAEGIPLGAYVYSHSASSEGGRAEAEHALQLLGGRALTLPIFIDIEADILGAGIDALMASALAFGETVKAAGYRWGVYASRSPWKTVLDADAVRAAGGYIWCAAYNNSGPSMDCDIWQRSASGRLAGYGGDLDMDVMYSPGMLEGGADCVQMGTASSAAQTVRWTAEMPTMATLCEGFGGGQVLVLQALLDSWGYVAQDNAGIFGAKTMAVVKRFQSDKGLAADGIVGNQTWTALIGG